MLRPECYNLKILSRRRIYKMVDKYIKYVKDNPENYWFKRKIYGWGWVPVKWQGWLLVGVFIIFLVLNDLSLMANPEPTEAELTWFIIKISLAIGMLIFICYRTGEKPRWQWGMPKDKE